MTKQQRHYIHIRNEVMWSSGCTKAEFDAATRKLVSDSSNPEQWIAAAKQVRVRCGRCAGTGQFITGTLNGKPTGPGGICFRCEGKGTQDHADYKRNQYYDTHRPVYV